MNNLDKPRLDMSYSILHRTLQLSLSKTKQKNNRKKQNLEKQLSCSWVEYKDCTVNGLRGEVSLKSFVDGNPIHICIINKPDNLVAEYFAIIL